MKAHNRSGQWLLDSDPAIKWQVMLLDWRYPGVMPLDMGEDVGKPSKWNTLRACRVLNWYYQ